MINLKNKINETDEKPKLIVPSNSSFTDFTNRILIISKGLDLEWGKSMGICSPCCARPNGRTEKYFGYILVDIIASKVKSGPQQLWKKYVKEQ